MTVEVLVCYADGRQVLEQREVPDFQEMPDTETEETTAE